MHRESHSMRTNKCSRNSRGRPVALRKAQELGAQTPKLNYTRTITKKGVKHTGLIYKQRPTYGGDSQHRLLQLIARADDNCPQRKAQRRLRCAANTGATQTALQKARRQNKHARGKERVQPDSTVKGKGGLAPRHQDQTVSGQKGATSPRGWGKLGAIISTTNRPAQCSHQPTRHINAVTSVTTNLP